MVFEITEGIDARAKSIRAFRRLVEKYIAIPQTARKTETRMSFRAVNGICSTTRTSTRRVRKSLSCTFVGFPQFVHLGLRVGGVIALRQSPPVAPFYTVETNRFCITLASRDLRKPRQIESITRNLHIAPSDPIKRHTHTLDFDTIITKWRSG